MILTPRPDHRYYAVRRHSPGTWGVAVISTLTGDVKEWHSLHGTHAIAFAMLRVLMKEEGV